MIELTPDEVAKLCAWATESERQGGTTGFGPKFDDAMKVAKAVRRRLLERPWVQLPSDPSAPPGYPTSALPEDSPRWFAPRHDTSCAELDATGVGQEVRFGVIRWGGGVWSADEILSDYRNKAAIHVVPITTKAGVVRAIIKEVRRQTKDGP